MRAGNKHILLEFLNGRLLRTKSMPFAMILHFLKEHYLLRSDLLHMLEGILHDTIGAPGHNKNKEFVAGILGELLFTFGRVGIVGGFRLRLGPHGRERSFDIKIIIKLGNYK